METFSYVPLWVDLLALVAGTQCEADEQEAGVAINACIDWPQS